MPAFMWSQADHVARDSYDAVMAGVPVYVPGRLNRSIATLSRAVTAPDGLGDDEAQRRQLPEDLTRGTTGSSAASKNAGAGRGLGSQLLAFGSRHEGSS